MPTVTPFPVYAKVIKADAVIAEVWGRWVTLLTSQVNLPAGTYLMQGTGDPNGVVTAPQGAMFQRTDGGALTTLYVKESGGTTAPTNTGWVGK
jgi:hypothetical protein